LREYFEEQDYQLVKLMIIFIQEQEKKHLHDPEAIIIHEVGDQYD
jgi:hypothetical protein